MTIETLPGRYVKLKDDDGKTIARVYPLLDGTCHTMAQEESAIMTPDGAAEWFKTQVRLHAVKELLSLKIEIAN